MPFKDLEQRRTYHREYMRERNAANPARNRATNKEWRDKNRWWYEEKRRKRVEQMEALKTANPCMDCQQFFPSECMDFDHRPGEQKLREVSKLTTSGIKWETVLEEIAKCDLICANCHRIRTRRRKNQLGAVA